MCRRVAVGNSCLETSAEDRVAYEAKVHSAWKIANDFTRFKVRVVAVVEVAKVLVDQTAVSARM